MAAPNLIEVSHDPGLRLLESNAAVRRARITRPRWNPKQWHPVYEEVVLLDCMGLARTDIAERMGFTPVHITNILKTAQAGIIRDMIIKRMRASHQERVEDRLERLSHKAMDRVEEIITDDKFRDASPFAVFDRSMKVLEGSGKIKKPDEGLVRNNTLIVSDRALEMLASMQLKSAEAKKLHAIHVEPSEEE